MCYMVGQRRESSFFDLPDFPHATVSLLVNRYALLKVSLNFVNCISSPWEWSILNFR